MGAGLGACIEPLEARRLFSATPTTQTALKPTAAPPSPIVLQARAHAAHSTVTGVRTSLAALATIDGLETGLTYTWSVTHSPGGTPPIFSANGTTAAMHVTVQFHKAGTYRLTCTIRDRSGDAITSTVSVVVTQTPTSLHFREEPSSAQTESSIQYRADVYDQFGRGLRTQPPIHYSIRAGEGTISVRTGNFYASIDSGDVEIQARAGKLCDTASLTVLAPDDGDESGQDQGTPADQGTAVNRGANEGDQNSASDQSDQSSPATQPATTQPDQSDQNPPSTQPEQGDTTMPSTQPDQSDEGGSSDSGDSGDGGDAGDGE
jgi:hypothetical protein